MRTTPIGTYEPHDLISFAWGFLLIDANTPILSPLTTPNVNVPKPNIDATKLEPNVTITTTNKYLIATATTYINPYEAEALMRITGSMSCNGLPSKRVTLIDTTTSVNFVSK